MKSPFFSIFFSFFTLIALAQPTTYFVTGKVADLQSKAKVPYATVAAFSKETNDMIEGVTTNEEGTFRLKTPTKNIKLEISFIGYKKLVIDNITFSNGKAELGTVELSQNVEMLDEAVVVGEKSSMEFKLDKRVFNVGTDITSSGMSAIDVLGNVPSVNVNIEGEVSLRGNTGVQILINGKPSVLAEEGSLALGTITADMIEKIEVITNPSAKYEAEGTSGIINVVLKKEEKKGFNGSVSVNTGIPHNHSVGVSLNKRTDKFNFFTQFGAGYRSYPRYSNSKNENLVTGEIIESEGLSFRNENLYNITIGSDYYLNKYNTITLSGNFAYEIEDQPSETQLSYFNQSELDYIFLRNEETYATNPKYQYDLQYKKEFKNNKDHVLLFSTLGRFFGKEKTSEFNNVFTFSENSNFYQEARTDFHSANYTFKLDYTNPITEKVTIEAGGLYEIDDVANDYAVFDEVNGTLIADPNLTNNFEFNQKVLGVYTTLAYEGEKWGIMGGLRAENTLLNTELTTTNQKNNQNYTNLFPSLHTSYKFNKTYSIQAGYSKRIYRPRLWELNPFFNITNLFNIRMGNPNLLPEFGDSYEITAIMMKNDLSLNGSVYYLFTSEVIDRVSFFDETENVNITTPINVGTRQKTGFEINGKYSGIKWLSINGDFNYGIFTREGAFQAQNFNFSSEQWSARLNTKIKLNMGLDIEVTPRYESAFETIQGTVSGFPTLDVGARQKLWNGKGVVYANVRDVFSTRIRESFVEQATFNVYSFSQRKRFITLGFSYSFGKGEAMTYYGGKRR